MTSQRVDREVGPIIDSTRIGKRAKGHEQKRGGCLIYMDTVLTIYVLAEPVPVPPTVSERVVFPVYASSWEKERRG